MFSRLSRRTLLLRSPPKRFNSTANGVPKPKSRHGLFYSETVPAMIPVFLLGSAVYLGLRLAQMKLVHEKHVEDAEARIKALEVEIADLEEKKRQPEVTTSVASSQKQSRNWW